MKLFLRWEDGNYPVEWDKGMFFVKTPCGIKSYETWSSLAKDIKTTLSYRNYFRLDTPKSETPSFFKEIQDNLYKEMDFLLEDFFQKESKNSFGIDIAKKQKDIRNLVLSGFGRKIFSGRYDPEDILQEVFKGLIIRNRGKCPWDQKKSSFGHYVHMVASCILNNYHRKQQRIPNTLDFGSLESDLGQWGHCEIEDSSDLLTSPTTQNLCGFVISQNQEDSDLVRGVFSHLVEGCTISEISDKVGVSPGKVSKIMKTIRSQTATWARQNDMSYMVPKVYQES